MNSFSLFQEFYDVCTLHDCFLITNKLKGLSGYSCSEINPYLPLLKAKGQTRLLLDSTSLCVRTKLWLVCSEALICLIPRESNYWMTLGEEMVKTSFPPISYWIASIYRQVLKMHIQRILQAVTWGKEVDCCEESSWKALLELASSLYTVCCIITFVISCVGERGWSWNQSLTQKPSEVW